MGRTFRRILVANRGEIAVRVIRTARELGYQTVAVYSDADEAALHARLADEKVCLGPAPPTESYLSIDRVIEAGLQAGCDAVHPGYGFLSENADFAAACSESGLTFIGPSPEAIRLMGNKAAARRRMAEAGVPCVPGYQGKDQSDEALAGAAREIGFPIMVKAAAGGGGRGMRLVEGPDDLASALAAARSEAVNAFGSDELILERALAGPRHVEIQVVADATGRVIHLGERDCSVQRRHQKIIEEAPSPVMTEALREAMGATAVEVARSIGYVGAGTVEFLLEDAGDFFFLEMNTRLQVEHPVTELVTGVDLVALQIQVAEGRSLPMKQAAVAISGHAIEARVYAEDPGNGFLPSAGPVALWSAPGSAGVRVDAGVETGSEISSFYDPMVAKVIAWGPSRDVALSRLRRALEETQLYGPRSNRDFLLDVLSRKRFVDGAATTAFLAQEYPDGVDLGSPPPALGAVAATALFLHDCEIARRRAISVAPELINWSSSARLTSHFRLLDGSERRDAVVEAAGGKLLNVRCDELEFRIRVLEQQDSRVALELDGRRVDAHYLVTRDGEVYVSFEARTARYHRASYTAGSEDETGAGGSIVAPMHGVIQGVKVSGGDRVAAGDRLVVLEAMKMQHELRANIDGKVAVVHCQVGDQVGAGSVLLEIEPAGADH